MQRIVFGLHEYAYHTYIIHRLQLKQEYLLCTIMYRVAQKK